MEPRQKLSDTLDNYSSPEYSLYDWQKNHCTHVKNWCKCQLLAGKRRNIIGHAFQPENERTRKVPRRHHYNDPKENICRSVALSLTVRFLSFHMIDEVMYMYISHVSHHLSFCETIKCFAGYPFGHYLPSSTSIEIPKESADCLRTMELQSSKIYCQTSFTYPDFPTARMTIWGRKARQQNKYSAKISMQYLHYDKAGTAMPITTAPHLHLAKSCIV